MSNHDRCHHCGDIMNWSTAREYDAGVCADCMRHAADPQQLKRLAAWFDDPNVSPNLAIATPCDRYTPGMLLRAIADGFQRQLDKQQGAQSDAG
jgi:hypothetical protein